MKAKLTPPLVRRLMTSLASLTSLTVGLLLTLSQTAHAISVTNTATQDVHAQYTDPNVGTGSIINHATRLECQWRSDNNQRRDPIIRFDITDLPAGAVVNSVTLRLYTIRGIAGEYLCKVGSRSDWVDAEPAPVGEQVITPGFVSYGDTIGTFDPGTAVGYVNITLSPTFVTGNGAITLVIFKNIKNSASDAQWASTENATVDWRPSLIVDFVAGPPSYQTRVETLADGSGSVVPTQDLPAGSSLTVYAIARDEANAYITNTPAGWSLTNVTGGVVNGDLVVQPGGHSAIFTGHGAGTVQILAQGNAANLVPSGVITVVMGPATQVRVEDQPDGSGTAVTANLTPGQTVTAYAIARDAGGNFVANEAAVWSVANVGGSLAGSDLVAAGDGKSALFTANLPGWGNLRATSGSLTSVDSGLISVVRELRWAGAGTVWDTSAAANWVLASDNATPSKFANGDTVYLDDFGTANPTLSLVGSLAPRTVLAQAYGAGFTLGGAGKITGPAVLNQSGSATLTLLTDNDYTGGTVMGGPITLGNGGATGSLGSGDIRFTATALLTFNRNNALTLTNWIYGSAAASIPDLFIQSGTVTLAGTKDNAFARARVQSGAQLVLAKASSGSVHALGGGLTIEAGGAVLLGGPGGDQIINSGSVTNDGTWDLQGFGEAIGGLYGTGVVDSTVFGTNSITLSVGGGGAINLAGEFHGIIRDSGFGGANTTNKLALSKGGNFVQVLGGTNSYHGDTTIASGTLALGSVTAIPSGVGFGNVNMNLNNVVLDLNGYSATINALNGNNASARVTNSTPNPGATLLTLGGTVETNNHTFAGAIVDTEINPTSVTKIGPATQVFSGANRYRGTTTVNAGKLTLITTHAATGEITVNSGGALGLTRSAAGASVKTTGLTFAAGATTNEFNLGTLASASTPLLYATNLVLNGTVYVNVTGSGSLAGTTRLTTFETVNGIGAFVLNSLPIGITGQLATNENSIDLVVASLPTYGTNLTITPGTGNVTISWPATHLGWSLQVQTNTLAVGLSTNWVTVPGSQTNTSVVMPISVTDPSVFYQMRYPSP